MNNHLLRAMATGYTILQQRLSCLARGIPGFRQVRQTIGTFCQEQRGAFALIFAGMFSVMLGLIAFGTEGTRYVYEKARLSDTLEQAALALTVENNSAGVENDNRNKALVSGYIQAYMPGSGIDNSSLLIEKKAIASGVTYHVDARTIHDSWSSQLSLVFPGFAQPGPEVKVGSHAGAQKNRSVPVTVAPETDMMFVVDFSESMALRFDNGGIRVIDELRSILMKLAKSVYAGNNKSRIGFVPFDLGVKSVDGQHCIIPWYSKRKVGDLDKTDSMILTRDQAGRYDGTVVNDDVIKNFIKKQVNISKTLDMITDPVDSDHTVAIPIHQIGYNFCRYYRRKTGEAAKGSQELIPEEKQARIVPLTSDIEQIQKINEMVPEGQTFMTSGILAGVKLLHQSSAVQEKKKKLLVMISDGDDNHFQSETRQLIDGGLCREIKKKGIEMVFIGINYTPVIDWENKCVGSENFYLPDTVNKLEKVLQVSVLHHPGSAEETGRNIPAR